MLADLATMPTEELLDRYEAIRCKPSAERTVLEREIGWRVHKAKGTAFPVILGDIQYTLDVNDELCRVRVRATWAREILRSRTGDHERERKILEAKRVRRKREIKLKVAS